MKNRWIVIKADSTYFMALASGLTLAQNAGPATTVGWVGRVPDNGSNRPVQGAPYSVTITIESIGTLADGSQAIHSSSGETARDSQGRTREEPPAPANFPQMVLIQDPVAHTAYLLSLRDKTAPQILPADSVPGGSEHLEIEQRLLASVDCLLATEQFYALWHLLDEIPMIKPSCEFDACVRRRLTAESTAHEVPHCKPLVR